MTTNSEPPHDVPGILPRPPFQLRSLPIPVRWEVTRRHPYYQVYWRTARAHYQRQPLEHEVERLLRPAAFAVLGSIGVTAAPLDPATEFAAMEANDLNAAWLSGAIHPITFGGLASLMIAALPKDTLGQVGLCLMQACCEDVDGEPPKKTKAMLDLTSLDMPDLDSYPDEPIVSINPAASGRDIEKSVSKLLRQWKKERKLSERRNRSDKYSEYLSVWDMREGWMEGQYDRTKEKTLREIAEELKVQTSTLHNHYRSAFELIVGHPYSPECWARVFGPIKLSELFGDQPGSVARQRPLVSPSRRDVPESVVSSLSGSGTPGLIGQIVDEDHLTGVAGLLSEIRRLLREGRTDTQILEELELGETALPAVEQIRERIGDNI